MHGHYAWGVDDGIKDQEEALQALKKASQQQITTIVATPHILCGKTHYEQINALKIRLESLKALAKTFGIEVMGGCELMLNEEVNDMMEANLLIPIENTRYLLCEENVRKNNQDFYEVFDDYLQELIYQGYTPIIAHVERYSLEALDLDYIRYLVELGCVIQVNTTSILGYCHPSHHANAIQLLNHQLVHIIATDTHNAAGKRQPNMLDCYHYLLKKHYPQAYIELLMYHNQKRILQNQSIIQPQFKISHFSKLLTKFK